MARRKYILLAMCFTCILYICLHESDSARYHQHSRGNNDGQSLIGSIQVAVQSVAFGKKQTQLSVFERERTNYTCNIPKLEPFHQDYLPYYKQMERDPCKIERYGDVSNGILSIKAPNLEEIKVAYIERSNDFHNKPLQWNTIYKSPKTSTDHGCLRLLLSDQLLFLYGETGEYQYERNVVPRLAVMGSGRQSTCNEDRKFKLTEEGFLIHSKTGKCVAPQIADSDHTQLVLSIHCDKFTNVEEKIQHEKSRQCLRYFADNGSIRFSSCEQATRLVFIDYNDKIEEVEHEVNKGLMTVSMIIRGKLHQEFHIAFPKEEQLSQKPKDLPNVLMVMIDSFSHSNAQRTLKKTYQYLKEDPNTVILQGQTVVGDATTPQLSAMLTGIPLRDLPEARRSFSNTGPVDRFPFIFRHFHHLGYKSFFSEDSPNLGAFNLRLTGFKNPPTTTYLRPLWIEMNNYLSDKEVSCHHEFAFRQVKKFFNAHRTVPKIAMTIFSEISHGYMNRPAIMDDDLVQLYNFLSRQQFADDTFVILFGDHGSRATNFRLTLQGKLEERLPFMAITTPKSFSATYPELMKRLQTNALAMTSYFDVHQTLMHVTDLRAYNGNNKFGISLFKDISKDRTCAETGVDDHWCPCLSYTPTSVDDQITRQVAHKMVESINGILKETVKADDSCVELRLDSIIRAGTRQPNTQVKQFKTTKEDRACDSCQVVIDTTYKYNDFVYEVVFSVQPSGANFEASADVKVSGNRASIISVYKEISRLNRYGSQPNCIASQYPHLRKYCYCKNYKKPTDLD